jgi:hypothetical protein
MALVLGRGTNADNSAALIAERSSVSRCARSPLPAEERSRADRQALEKGDRESHASHSLGVGK